MPRLVFRGGDMPADVAVEYCPDGTTTVLELARRHDVPLHWRCGLGTCGTCAVRVIVLEGDLRSPTRKEASVLSREGKPALPAEGAPAWRLMCGYVPSGESLRLEW